MHSSRRPGEESLSSVADSMVLNREAARTKSGGLDFQLILSIFLCILGEHGGLVVNMLDCQSRSSGFKSRSGQKFGLRFLFHLCSLANSAMMSTLTSVCQWEETVRERTGHPPSSTEAKKNTVSH